MGVYRHQLGLPLPWWSNFSRVTFHVSSILACQFLSVSQFMETSATKCLLLMLILQGCTSLLLFFYVYMNQKRREEFQSWPGIFRVRIPLAPGSSHTSDLKTGTPVAILPGGWHYKVSARTGWPGVSILWLGEMESWICNLYLSVAVHKIVWTDPSLRYSSMLLGC